MEAITYLASMLLYLTLVPVLFFRPLAHTGCQFCIHHRRRNRSAHASPVHNKRYKLDGCPFHSHQCRLRTAGFSSVYLASLSLQSLLIYLLLMWIGGADVETFRVDSEHCIIKFTVPAKLVGYSLNELKLYEKFQLKLIALKRGQHLQNSLDIDYLEYHVTNLLPENSTIEANDQLVCYRRTKDFRRFWKAL